MREDYSPNGDAWNHFSHDQARSRAYRWGEDGIAGISDNRAAVVPRARAVERADPILKERMFGLTNGEGNHGEDGDSSYVLDTVTSFSLSLAASSVKNVIKISEAQAAGGKPTW